jgi:hypothetical protein
MRQSVAATTPNDEKLVLETISTYLQALHKNDKGLFLDAFAETANVSHCSIADEKMTVWSLPDFIDVVDGLHKSNGHVEEFHTDADVAVTGPVASVHVPFLLKLGSQEVTGTDVFALARADGKWKITSKLYSA